MANPIVATSKVYEKLLVAYQGSTDKYTRFSNCYDIVDEADYCEIHYIISMLKEFENTGDTSSIPVENLERLANSIKSIFAGEERGRRAFLLDILEEARERKRPQ